MSYTSVFTKAPLVFTASELGDAEFVNIVIEYDEAMGLLEQHAQLPRRTRNDELEAILQCIVMSYFSRYNARTGADTHQRRLAHLCEDNSFDNFENSELCHEITLAVIEDTQRYLPGFVAHNETHACRVYNLEPRGRCTMVVTTDRLGLRLFSHPLSNTQGNFVNANPDYPSRV